VFQPRLTVPPTLVGSERSCAGKARRSLPHRLPGQGHTEKCGATAFLATAIANYESLGIKIERVMTDNGSCYTSLPSGHYKSLGLTHIRTKPYTPKTTGKAEPLIQASLREWAYARAYQHSRQGEDELPTGSN
jgi:transposase InsO family protein